MLGELYFSCFNFWEVREIYELFNLNRKPDRAVQRRWAHASQRTPCLQLISTNENQDWQLLNQWESRLTIAEPMRIKIDNCWTNVKQENTNQVQNLNPPMKPLRSANEIQDWRVKSTNEDRGHATRAGHLWQLLNLYIIKKTLCYECFNNLTGMPILIGLAKKYGLIFIILISHFAYFYSEIGREETFFKNYTAEPQML